jgi:hypothetical protein
MKIVNILVGEIVLLFASIFIFRGVWTLLDQYLGYSYLLEMVLVGLVLTIAGLVLLNREVECEMRDTRKQNK